MIAYKETGSLYKGFFEKGKRTGNGVLFFEGGNYLECGFLNDNAEGYGIIYH